MQINNKNEINETNYSEQDLSQNVTVCFLDMHTHNFVEIQFVSFCELCPHVKTYLHPDVDRDQKEINFSLDHAQTARQISFISLPKCSSYVVENPTNLSKQDKQVSNHL